MRINTEVWFLNTTDSNNVIMKTLSMMDYVPRKDEYVYLTEQRFRVVEVEWAFITNKWVVSLYLLEDPTL